MNTVNLLNYEFTKNFLIEVDWKNIFEKDYDEKILKWLLNNYLLSEDQKYKFSNYIDSSMNKRDITIDRNELFTILEESGLLYKKLNSVFWWIDETAESIYTLMEKIFIEQLKEAILY